MIYSLDTNVLIDAVRRPESFSRLRAFLGRAIADVRVSSVAATEFAAGALARGARRSVEDEVLASFERRDRVVAPSVSEWKRAGQVLAELRSIDDSVSMQNDVLIAVQARERGWTVVTRDSDFVRLRRSVRGLRVVAPFPDMVD